MAIITDLVTRFSFKGSHKPLLAFNSALSTSIGLVAKAGFAVTGAAAGVAYWVNSISRSTEGLYRMNYATGLSTEKIKTLSIAAIKAGGDAKGMESVLTSLTSRIQQASLQGDDTFSALGISAIDSMGQLRKADDVLFEIGQKLRDNKDLAEGSKMALAGQLGIDPMTFKLITQSDSEIAKVIEQARRLNTATQAQTDSFAAFNQSMRLMGERFEQVQLKIAVTLLPAIQKITDEFIKLIDNNIPSIQKAFQMLSDAVMWVVKDLAKGESGEIGGFVKDLYGMFVNFFSKMDIFLSDMNNLLSWFRKDDPKATNTAPQMQEKFSNERNPDGTYKYLNSPLQQGATPLQQYVPPKESATPLPQYVPPKESEKRDAIRNNSPFFRFERQKQPPQSQAPVINQSVAIEVRTDDPKLAATTIADELEKQFNMAYFQSGRGVYAG